MNVRERLFTAETRIPRPLDEVFAFFSNAANLDRITPPWVGFKTLTPGPIEMREGTIVDYKLKIRGLPLRWRTRIAAWDPPRRFVDEQIRGPYRLWVHEHAFRADGDETIMTDRVRYAVRCDPLVHDLWVAPDVRRIFEFRNETIRALFPPRPAAAAPAV
jgi:ligand-binding SRPBCC domain-containing protein